MTESLKHESTESSTRKQLDPRLKQELLETVPLELAVQCEKLIKPAEETMRSLLENVGRKCQETLTMGCLDIVRSIVASKERHITDTGSDPTSEQYCFADFNDLHTDAGISWNSEGCIPSELLPNLWSELSLPHDDSMVNMRSGDIISTTPSLPDMLPVSFPEDGWPDLAMPITIDARYADHGHSAPTDSVTILEPVMTVHSQAPTVSAMQVLSGEDVNGEVPVAEDARDEQIT